MLKNPTEVALPINSPKCVYHGDDRYYENIVRIKDRSEKFCTLNMEHVVP